MDNRKPERSLSSAKETAKEEEEEEEAETGSSKEVEDNLEGQNQERETEERNSRRPFTSLSQVDADLALARTLQEQERAYMMLRMGGRRGFVDSDSVSEYEEVDDDDNHVGNEISVEDEDYEEDAFDVAAEIDPSAFDDDEAYARALQEAEARDLSDRFRSFNGVHEWVVEDVEGDDNSGQEIWSDVDPDELSYEELIALGEAVGTESKGLTHDRIAALPSVSYKASDNHELMTHQCVICQLDYEDGEAVVVLSCKHTYHPDCINSWLQINKVCPICNTEVTTQEDNSS